MRPGCVLTSVCCSICNLVAPPGGVGGEAVSRGSSPSLTLSKAWGLPRTTDPTVYMLDQRTIVLEVLEGSMSLCRP